MRRILAALCVLALSASFAHATNRFTFETSARRRPAVLTMRLSSHRPHIHQPQTQRPEIRGRETRRPLVPIPISEHKVSVEKVRSQRPLIYASDPGSQFPTPEDPK